MEVTESALALEDDTWTRVSSTGVFAPSDVGWVSDVHRKYGATAGTPWDGLRHAHMSLPAWFQHGLDPLSEAYSEQQHRLWQLLSGIDRLYAPDIDEKEHAWDHVDPVRTPGYLARRDAEAIEAASDHVLATGMFLKHSGLRAGDRALEYGAGFGQTALALARLGVQVDTVDISTTFCSFVTRQADFFQVPLTAFHGHFGINPRPGQTYKLIWFYESFHHCVDFQRVVHQIREHLAPGGRVILGGEPIIEREYAAVPYPWGVRLQSEVVSVVRQYHWFELGFTEDFIFELFTRAGFTAKRINCEPSLFGRLYVFERRTDEIHLGTQWLPTVLAAAWHAPEADGRWTTADSRLPLDAGDTCVAIDVDLANLRRVRQHVTVSYGGKDHELTLAAGEYRTYRLQVIVGAGELRLRCHSPALALLDRFRRKDGRPLGVLVRRVRYVSRA